MRSDGYAIRNGLDRVGRSARSASDDEKTLNTLRRLERRLNASVRKRSRRKAGVPTLTYPHSLPITRKKDEIVEAIRNHQVVVITGETGSGKTTQIPKMCLEAGRGIDGLIGCTQPRRAAAITVAHRIAEELREEIGKSVGYKIRFEEKTGRDSYIKIMTDGILLVETRADPYLNNYDTLIVDEAHERSLNIDFTLGIIRTLLNKRKYLKLIITSATIDTEKFSRAFDNAPVVEVSGRAYPVEMRYRPIDPDLEERGDITYIDAAVSAVDDLKGKERGDILIFMPSERDIRETCELLESRNYAETTILPMFARLSWSEQRRVFLPTHGRKIVVATNVAETSITIVGIRYVIDTGLARIARYSPRSRTSSLPVRAISRSSSDQRKGRCGRVQDGICIRLYSEEDYEDRPLFTPPEILRSNLAEVILRMLVLNIDDISSFPFIDRPDPRNIKDGFDTLKELGAIEAVAVDQGSESGRKKVRGDRRTVKNRFVLTEKGRMMARIPVDPRISRMLIEAGREGCVEEVAIIASALSIQDPRERPAEKEAQADRMHARFKDTDSDFIVLLNIWNRYHDVWNILKTQNRMRKFCKEHFLSYRRMREWKDIHNEISAILKEEAKNGAFERRSVIPDDSQSRYSRIHRSILSGHLSNIATKKEKNIYTAAGGREIMIFPGSGLFGSGGSWIAAAQMVETSRLFARVVANIDSDWLEELGGYLCRYTYSGPHWARDRGEVVAFEQVSLYGLIIVQGRPVSYGRINPDEASGIFIRSALVEGNMDKSLSFLAHNRGLIEEISGMEDKIRRRDILVGEDALSQFYEKRLGGVYDVRTLRKIILDKGEDDFLKMSKEDVLQYFPDEEEVSLYPDELAIRSRKLQCSYRFDPGKPDDGITLKIPATFATIPAESTQWLVPGLLREKITMLIKGLPKEFRKKLVPIPKTVDVIMSEMKRGKGSLISALGKFIYEKFGLNIPASAWSPDSLPDYVKMRFSVIDSEGNELCSGRDVGLLEKNISSEVELPGFDRAKAAWEKRGLTMWDFGDLPESIALNGTNDPEVYAYPALEKQKDGCVNLRLFKDERDAQNAHVTGVKALCEIHFKKELKFLKRLLILQGDMKKWANYFGGARHLEDAVYERVSRHLFQKNIRTEEEFLNLVKSAGPKIFLKGQGVLSEIEPALKAYHDTRTTFHTMETTNRSNRTVLAFLAGLRKDLDRLMPGRFPELYETERLKHMVRYLNALAIRAERGIFHLDKDRSRAIEVRVCSDRLGNILNNLPDCASDEKRRAIDEFFWMIEEYKVSLFAQELKTPFPVSRKRLEKKIGEIERMV